LLSACSDADWDDLLSFTGAGSDAPAAPAASVPPAAAPRPVAAANAPDPFCMAVAGQDLKDGAFDQTTQQKMALRDYKQCMDIFRAD
jgi:hypothetical protein